MKLFLDFDSKLNIKHDMSFIDNKTSSKSSFVSSHIQSINLIESNFEKIVDIFVNIDV